MSKNNKQERIRGCENDQVQKDLWKTSAPSVRLDEIRFQSDDFDFIALYSEVWQSRLEACVKRIDEKREGNGGWFKLVGGGWYFAAINAVMNSCFSSRYYSYWPTMDDGACYPLSSANKSLQGVIPTETELKIILESEWCKYPHNGTSDKYLVRTDDLYGGNCAAAQFNTPELPVGQSLVAQIFAGRKTAKIATKIGCRYLNTTGLGSDTPGFTASILPIYRLNFACYAESCAEKPLSTAELLVLWALYDVTPLFLAEDREFNLLKDMIKNQPTSVAIEGGVLRFVSPVKPDGEDYNEAFRKGMIDRLLSCDVARANIKPRYSEKQLTSPDANCGHWDLWGDNAETKGEEVVGIPLVCYARNPRCDVKSDGVIGIDFGTKNTTVVRKVDKEASKPMRVGHANFEELPTESSDYENPTVMQFVDFKTFRKAYVKRPGRPLTRWSDLTISHTAASLLRDAQEGACDSYTSFLAELKQWAGGNETLRMTDLQGREYVLPPYCTLVDANRIDPIEIYAYYLGLNINHMRNGIYLRYELSYPVTYDKDVLERLRMSFERGIRKSLPPSILRDEELMKGFYVRFGASEPAAYALCALQEYGFKPVGPHQRFFYGVFDFGGGTTDFDYGIYRDVDDDEADAGYDYVLEHFRPSGDKYLGGENLLQLLAYEVFKSNRKTLLSKKIMFSRPLERDNTSFEGEEGLVADSPEAKINMMQVMEALRPLWETQADPMEAQNSQLEEVDTKGKSGQTVERKKRSPEERPSSNARYKEYQNRMEKLRSGKIAVTLFDRDGQQLTNVALDIDVDQLQARLKDRIRNGVVNFFVRMKEAFKEPAVPRDIEKVSIFLAGNSCKSSLVSELFAEQLKALEKDDSSYADRFEIFPPLGSDAAFEKMSGRGVTPREGIEQPTGKTGVAFGLVMGRDGGSIKVIDRNKDKSGAIRFRFYVGKKRKGLFMPILTTDTKPNAWEKVMCVGERKTVEIHYSDLAEAGTGTLPVEKTFMKSCPIEQPLQRDMSLFICVKSANAFAWAVARDEKSISAKDAKTVRLD